MEAQIIEQVKNTCQSLMPDVIRILIEMIQIMSETKTKIVCTIDDENQIHCKAFFSF